MKPQFARTWSKIATCWGVQEGPLAAAKDPVLLVTPLKKPQIQVFIFTEAPFYQAWWWISVCLRHSEFQDSQNYVVRTFSQKLNDRQTDRFNSEKVKMK